MFRSMAVGGFCRARLLRVRVLRSALLSEPRLPARLLVIVAGGAACDAPGHRRGVDSASTRVVPGPVARPLVFNTVIVNTVIVDGVGGLTARGPGPGAVIVVVTPVIRCSRRLVCGTRTSITHCSNQPQKAGISKPKRSGFGRSAHNRHIRGERHTHQCGDGCRPHQRPLQRFPAGNTPQTATAGVAARPGRHASRPGGALASTTRFRMAHPTATQGRPHRRHHQGATTKTAITGAAPNRAAPHLP